MFGSLLLLPGPFREPRELYPKPQIPFSHVLLNRGTMAFLLLCHLGGPNILPWHCLTPVGSGGSRRALFALSTHPVPWGISFQFFWRSQNLFTAQYIIIYCFESQGLRIGMKFITANLNHCTI